MSSTVLYVVFVSLTNRMNATRYSDVSACVDAILDRIGRDIVVGTPLGVGKPNHILNELVDRAVADPGIDLEIWTALSLSPPDWDSELERRLVEPLSERLFGAYPDLRYDDLLQANELPDNVEVNQFYFQPGKHVRNSQAQQSHYSVNYTHVLRTFIDAEPNLLLQLVGKGERNGTLYYNLGSNPDVSRDLIDWMHDRQDDPDRECMVVGQVTDEMPFMYGEAPVPAPTFDAVLDGDSYRMPLFGTPSEPVSVVDHAIALRVSSLVRDGGTLQIGIGSLGDAIGWALELRHTRPETYRDLVESIDVLEDAPELVAEYGGLDRFEEGLYGATEMFVEAFLHLYACGVLDRAVYDDADIQRLVDAGTVAGGLGPEVLAELLDSGAISAPLDADDVRYLKRWGVFDDEVVWADGDLRLDEATLPTDVSDPAVRETLASRALGDSLDGGAVLHGGFFIGSSGFYEGLRDLSEADRRNLLMRSVQFTNHLYGDEALKRRQRRDARFVNTGMKATVRGGVVSDGLDDGRVISGVGGQFNFVNQAQELDDGRSILMVRSTRGAGRGVESNVVWNYGHLTIPRHLRDIVVTEYGVADLRGKSDAEVIGSMIEIADSRFQDDLVERAKAAGKLPDDWEVPPAYRNNTPAALESALGPYHESELPRFPYGTDLTDEELALGRALRTLEDTVQERDLGTLLDSGTLRKTVRVPHEAVPYLERLDLEAPETPRERLLRRVVVLALADSGVI